MSFSWSAGDIVATLQLLHKVTTILKATGGASFNYQETTAFSPSSLASYNIYKRFKPHLSIPNSPRTSNHSANKFGIDIDVLRVYSGEF
jgi:hypothetical protein